MGPPEQSKPTPEQIADAARRQLVDEGVRRQLADAAERSGRELQRTGRRFVWIVASPVVLGAALLIFLVIAWGVFDLIGSSGTTSTALIVSALLVLVPGVLAAWQGKTATEHAEQVLVHAENVLNPPPRPAVTAFPSEVSPDADAGRD
jgi:hypothetical protein